MRLQTEAYLTIVLYDQITVVKLYSTGHRTNTLAISGAFATTKISFITLTPIC
jgi:hypothetical protein